jgi:hypothetical protein
LTEPLITVDVVAPWLVAKVVVDAVHGLVETDMTTVAVVVIAGFALPRPTGRRNAIDFQILGVVPMSAVSTIVCEREAGAVVVEVVL